jgi:AcrR family transcriptional regulator
MTSGIAKRRSAAKGDKGNTSYQQRRQEIIAASAKVFKRKGYGGTSLSDIAEELQTDRANLYYYVASKQELFEEVVTDAIAHNLTRAEAIRDGEGTPPEKLRTLIEQLMTSYAEYYPFLYVYIQENLSHVTDSRAKWATSMRGVNKKYEDIVIAIIEEGYAKGSLRNVGPSWVVAHGLLGVVGWTNRWFDPENSRASAEEIGRVYADMILEGLTNSG